MKCCGNPFAAQAKLIKAALEDALLQWKAGYPGVLLTKQIPLILACNGCSMCCLVSHLRAVVADP